ncbi:MAG: type VII toxin-antitoxin system HepT family RNase toxin [Desulfosalsimonas sp.]
MNLDHDRMRNKISDIQRSLDRLKRLKAEGRKKFLTDEDCQDIARSRLLSAIEAALNICFHINARKLKKVPEDYGDCFMSLGQANLIDPALAARLADMARFRNRLVHLYWDIDYSAVYDIIENHLVDLENFSVRAAGLL